MSSSQNYIVPKRAYLVRVFGKVQGVSFRVFLKHTAQHCGLVGWVCNETDGSLKCVVQGEQHLIASFLIACQKGPRHATIQRVETIDIPIDISLSAFSIRT